MLIRDFPTYFYAYTIVSVIQDNFSALISFHHIYNTVYSRKISDKRVCVQGAKGHLKFPRQNIISSEIEFAWPGILKSKILSGLRNFPS